MRRFASVFAFSLLVSSAAVAMAAEAPAPFSEPNLKLPKDSGGLVNSKLISDAPLPSDFSMGKKTAQLNLIEYASLSCTHCAHFSAKVLPDLQKKYIETGKVRYIMRPFPLNEPALKGAMLLDCLGEQDGSKYYTFARVLFDAQNKWAFDSNFLTNLETIAAVGGVSKEQFAGCTNSTDRESKLLKAQKLAKEEIKIPHTPYIIIGNEIYAGERSPEAIGAFIDKKLAELPKKKAAE